jgi:hypothetical protein
MVTDINGLVDNVGPGRPQERGFWQRLKEWF